MKRRLAEMLAPVTEVLARFRPMSKSEDRVLDELSAVYGTPPEKRAESSTTGRA